jgi:hypothetical protein
MSREFRQGANRELTAFESRKLCKQIQPARAAVIEPLMVASMAI